MKKNTLNSNKIAALAIAIAMACGFGSSAFAMTSAEHKMQEQHIAADYKVNKDKCNSLNGNAKDICTSEAKGMEKVAKAELAAQYKPSAKADAKVRQARADAIYHTAKEKCDDLAGNPKDVCIKDAKSSPRCRTG